MSDFVISTRYALALMELAEKNNTFESVVSNMEFINNTLKDSRELRNFLSSPIIESSKKIETLIDIFGKHVDSDVNKFLRFITKKGRESFLVDICNRFLSLSNEKLNRLSVIITSAVELTDEQKEAIIVRLEKKLNKTILPTYKIDNNIIGGFKARYSDTVIDASVKHQLEILKDKLFVENYLKN